MLAAAIAVMGAMAGAGVVAGAGCGGSSVSSALGPSGLGLAALDPASMPGAVSPEDASTPAAGNAGHAPAQVPPVAMPDPAAGGPVSLRQMLAYADQHAPALHVARQAPAQGRAAMAAATPWLPDNPEIEVAAGPRWLPSGDDGGPAGESSGGRAMDLSVSVRQTIEVAGERGLRVAAAERTQARLDAGLAQARWDVHRDVHDAFHQVLVARERARVAARMLAFQERLLEIAQQRLQAGDTSPLPVRVAEGETAQARVAGIAAAQAHEAARLRLAEVAGWPVTHPPEPAGALDPPRLAPGPDALRALARRHQPALPALHAALAEARARVALAERERWPKPTLGVSLAREAMGTDESETVIMGSVGVALPLWRRNPGERAQARAEQDMARARLQAFEQQLGAQLVRQAGAVDAAARRLAGYGQEILPRFEDNLRLLERAYELGEIDILQVSVARERFLRIQSDALDAHADYFEAVAALEAVVGTDPWPDEPDDHAPAKEDL